MTYREELVKAMAMLSKYPDTIFIGQSVCWSGHAIYSTLEEAKVPLSKRLELPVFEETQLGVSLGMSLAGYLPISIFPRMDFLMCCMNQLVNHLDKMEVMSHSEWKPKVIIRTMVGSKKPLDGGIQHTQNHIRVLREALSNIHIYELNEPSGIVAKYEWALLSPKSTILVEYGELY